MVRLACVDDGLLGGGRWYVVAVGSQVDVGSLNRDPEVDEEEEDHLQRMG